MDTLTRVGLPEAEAAQPPSGWRVDGASVRGLAHERPGQVCQDAHAARAVAGGWVALAVADGAGSAPFSDVGARAAASRAVEALAECVAGQPLPADEAGWRPVLEGVVLSCRDAVAREAASLGQRPDRLATTLLAVLAGPEGTAAVQVGDGGIVVWAPDGSIEPLTTPAEEEYVNETTFLTSAGALAAARVAYRPGPARGVASLTDGLQMLALAYPGWAPHAPFFHKLFDYFEAATDREAARLTLEGFLGGRRVRERTDDDVTLVVATRGPVPNPKEVHP